LLNRVGRFLPFGGKPFFSMEKTGVAKIFFFGKNPTKKDFATKIVRRSVKITLMSEKNELLLYLKSA